MGKSGAGKRRQRAVHRQSVKQSTSTALTLLSAPRSAVSSSTSTELTAHLSQAEQLVSRAQYSEAASLLEAALESSPPVAVTVAALHDLLALSHTGMANMDAALHHALTCMSARRRRQRGQVDDTGDSSDRGERRSTRSREEWRCTGDRRSTCSTD